MFISYFGVRVKSKNGRSADYISACSFGDSAEVRVNKRAKNIIIIKNSFVYETGTKEKKSTMNNFTNVEPTDNIFIYFGFNGHNSTAYRIKYRFSTIEIAR